MFLKKIKVYHYFWIVSIMILIIGFVFSGETFDINVHDTYFVIETTHLAYLLFIGYFLLGLGYWLVEKIFKRILVKSLTIIHTIILIGCFAIYWLMFFYNQLKPKNELFPLLDDGSYAMNSMLFTSFILIAFVAQPIYIINILIAFFRKSKAFS